MLCAVLAGGTESSASRVGARRGACVALTAAEKARERAARAGATAFLARRGCVSPAIVPAVRAAIVVDEERISRGAAASEHREGKEGQQAAREHGASIAPGEPKRWAEAPRCQGANKTDELW